MATAVSGNAKRAARRQLRGPPEPKGVLGQCRWEDLLLTNHSDYLPSVPVAPQLTTSRSL